MTEHEQNLNLQEQLKSTGALLFNNNEVPLSEAEWSQLENISKQVDYEHVIGGDAGEGHSVFVSRFVNDVKEPIDLQAKAIDVKNIVMSKKMLSFYQRFIGSNKLCLRRCQANRLENNDYIGKHIDQDSNPDYIASIVFHFKSNYKGGDFISQPGTEGEVVLHPEPHSVVVNRGDTWHEVKPVVSGTRRTLACFLSTEFGESQNNRKDIEVAKY